MAHEADNNPYQSPAEETTAFSEVGSGPRVSIIWVALFLLAVGRIVGAMFRLRGPSGQSAVFAGAIAVGSAVSLLIGMMLIAGDSQRSARIFLGIGVFALLLSLLII